MSPFASALKTWRKTRRYSQLDLAHQAEVSARHVAFLETGKANPSREMIGKLSDALDLPLSARNELFTSAGFAVRYTARDWTDDEMAPIRAAVDFLLRRHAPYPAFALDHHWHIAALNEPAERLFGPLGITRGASMIDVIKGGAIRTAIENWSDVCHFTYRRLRTESLARGGDPCLDAAAAEIGENDFGPPSASGPVVPITLAIADQRLSLFSTITQFGTPEDLTLDDLRIEHFFPADEPTRNWFEGQVATNTDE